MPKLSEYQKERRNATTMRIYSTEKTKLPDAWPDALKHFTNLSDETRVLAFDLKVWLKPARELRAKGCKQ